MAYIVFTTFISLLVFCLAVPFIVGKKVLKSMTIITKMSISPSVLSVFASCILRLQCLMFLILHIFLWTFLASFLFVSIAIAIPVIYSVKQLPITYFLTNVLGTGLSSFSNRVEPKTERDSPKKKKKKMVKSCQID